VIFEEFVASNAVLLAQSKVQEEWISQAIYVGDTMVRFTMFGYCHENKFHMSRETFSQ
jgi:diamine N-acetyltransferase